MLAIGFIWAAFAPLIMLVVIAVLAFALKRFGVRRYWLAALVVFIVPVGGIYALDRRQFAEVCAQGEPTGIFKTAEADGFVLTSGTANSFGTRYVSQDGFRFFETLDYMQGYKGWARYELDADKQVVTTKIAGPTARYEVKETHKSLPGTISVSTIEVLDRTTGEVLARARDGHFLGGRVSLFLGAWGSAKCTNLRSEEGARAFRQYYYLARETLRPGKPASQ